MYPVNFLGRIEFKDTQRERANGGNTAIPVSISINKGGKHHLRTSPHMYYWKNSRNTPERGLLQRGLNCDSRKSLSVLFLGGIAVF